MLADDLFDDIVGNPLTDAAKHTESATRVDVTARDDGSTAVLPAADDGSPSRSTDGVISSNADRKESEHDGAAFVLEPPQE